MPVLRRCSRVRPIACFSPPYWFVPTITSSSVALCLIDNGAGNSLLRLLTKPSVLVRSVLGKWYKSDSSELDRTVCWLRWCGDKARALNLARLCLAGNNSGTFLRTWIDWYLLVNGLNESVMALSRSLMVVGSSDATNIRIVTSYKCWSSLLLTVLPSSCS